MLPVVVQRVVERLEREAAPGLASELWTATQVAMGLRYPEEVIRALNLGARSMRESVVYQAILAEGRQEGEAQGREQGRVEEARRLVRRQGELRFGPPDRATVEALERVTSIERLEGLAIRVISASSWEELLQEV
jgi:predicted transposase YdaD